MTFRFGISALALLVASPALSQELNALVWCDHADPALVAPFEEKFGVKVNLKEYEGTAAGMAILDGSQPGEWDVLVIDAVDVGRAVEAGKLAPIPAEALPTADFFPELVMAKEMFPEAEVIRLSPGPKERKLVDDLLEDIPFG